MIDLRRFITGIMVSILVAVSVTGSNAWAQRAGGVAGNPEGEISSVGPRKHLATIVFAGLAGAILGLSTLSFYGRPQDKLNNIAMGFALGVIGGAMFTTYKAATEPREFYGQLPPSQELAPIAWSEQEPFVIEAAPIAPVSWQFSF